MEIIEQRTLANGMAIVEESLDLSYFKNDLNSL